jgi:alpha-tubulin suppressor-like RCC1 family protein
VLSSNGTVTAWGDDFFGQTNVPTGLSNVVAISAGGQHSLAVLANGTVQAWGDFDDGLEADVTVPSGLSNVVAVAAGGEASLALRADGTLVAWGNPANPSATNVPSGTFGVKALSAGFEHNVVIESGMENPGLFTQPVNQYAPSNGTVTFSAQGGAVAGVQFQWQFNGMNITGATNSTLTLSNTQASDNGSYQVIVSTAAGSITSSPALFGLVLSPQIVFTNPPAPGPTWITYGPTLGVTVNAVGQSNYPLYFSWQLNGTNLDDDSASYAIPNLPTTSGNLPFTVSPTNDGNYTMTVTNIAGTNTLTWDIRLALPGMAETWGSDGSGECDRPVGVTNVAGIAAGEYQSIAVTDSGTVAQWGQYWDGVDFYSVTNTNYVTLPPASNVVAVAAGLTQALALINDGTVRAWGLDGAYGTEVPTGLSNITAIACGWEFNVALLANGTVTSWGDNYFGQTNVPAGLSNVVAITAGAQHTLALLSNGTVQAWGDGDDGDTNIPAGLSNVVAIAAGESHNLALLTNGTVVAWGYNGFGQTNVPVGLSNIIAVAAGDNHNVALQNDGTLVEWGDNSSGQTNIPGELPTNFLTSSGGLSPISRTNVYPPVVVKLIAAGGNHTMAAIFSPLVQYPIDVSKDLLLIYNINSPDSSNVCQYYLTHRPMVANCSNVLGINCTTNFIIVPANLTNIFLSQVQTWLSNNPTKRPLYVILFQDLPGEVNTITNEQTAGDEAGVQYQLRYWTAPGWQPFVSSINMNNLADAGESTNLNSSDGTSDCIAYIDKLANMAQSNPPGSLFISARAAGYGNTNWYFDDVAPEVTGDFFQSAAIAVTNISLTASVIYTNGPFDSPAHHITNASNVAAFASWGVHGYFLDNQGNWTNGGYATNGYIQFTGQSGWYIIETAESFNGERGTSQGNFLEWFAINAFGGANHSNTPVGAVSNVEEPGGAGLNNPAVYFGDWAAGRIFSYCAWNSFPNFSQYLQVIGDPFTKQ